MTSANTNLGQLIGQLWFAIVLLVLLCSLRISVSAKPIPLTNVLPKIESLHEQVKQLLIKNAELSSKILQALQAQSGAKIEPVQDSTTFVSANKSDYNGTTLAQTNNKTDLTWQQENIANKFNKSQQQTVASQHSTEIHQLDNKQTATPLTAKQRNNLDDVASNKSMINFHELDEFNKWVEWNLVYAVENTRASAEALKEEAQHNNGTVEYSEQAIEDGFEGVKYWQSAVLFQDKTLKNEKFEPIEL